MNSIEIRKTDRYEDYFSRPINTTEVLNKIYEIENDLAPYDMDYDELVFIIDAFEHVSLTGTMDYEIQKEIVRNLISINSNTGLTSVDYLRDELVKYDTAIIDVVSLLRVYIEFQLGSITKEELMLRETELINAASEEWIGCCDYLDFDHLIYNAQGDTDQIYISPCYADNYEYLEYSGTSHSTTDFLESLSSIDKDIDIYVNDAQMILIEDMVEDGYIYNGPNELLYYPKLIKKKDDTKMITQEGLI